MPKDLIHFKIAEQTATLLKDTQYAPGLTDQVDGLLLGSVFHDALFYAVLPGSQRLETLAHRLHGAQGQDTFELIRTQAKHTQRTKDKALPAALLVGLISHLYADVVMHPFVWHMTGNYYDDDPDTKSQVRQRHRALESLMDMVACPEMLGRARYRIRTMLRRTPQLMSHGIPLNEFSLMAMMSPEKAQRQLNHAWTIYSAFQWSFSMPTLARTLFTLRKTLPQAGAEIAMLFYAPQLNEQAASLRGQMKYLHPVTGCQLKASLTEMMEKAATKAAALCRQLEPSIFGNEELILPGPGPSMDAGISNVPTDEMRFFANPPYPSLD